MSVDALISGATFQLLLMKPLSYHHLNVFSRTCSYPPTRFPKVSCSNLCSLGENKRLTEYMYVYFDNPQKWLNLINLITVMLSICLSLCEPDVAHIACALFRKIQDKISLRWLGCKFLHNQKSKILFLRDLFSAWSGSVRERQEWAAPRDGEPKAGVTARLADNVLTSKGTTPQLLSKESRDGDNEMMVTMVSQQSHHSHTDS